MKTEKIEQRLWANGLKWSVELSYSGNELVIKPGSSVSFDQLQKLSTALKTTNINIGYEHGYYDDVDTVLYVRDYK